MAEFTEDDEEDIRMEMIRLEAAKRIRILEFFSAAQGFFDEFKPGTLERYTHKMSTAQVLNLLAQYTGLSVSSDLIAAAFRQHGYRQFIFKDEHPVQSYWVFA